MRMFFRILKQTEVIVSNGTQLWFWCEPEIASCQVVQRGSTRDTWDAVMPVWLAWASAASRSKGMGRMIHGTQPISPRGLIVALEELSFPFLLAGLHRLGNGLPASDFQGARFGFPWLPFGAARSVWNRWIWGSQPVGFF